MAYTTVNKSTSYMSAIAYAGNGSATQTVTNSFQTDFSWIKHRGTTAAHAMQDVLRGWNQNAKLSSNERDPQNDSGGATWENYGGVSAVSSSNFTVSLGSNTPYQTNANSSNYIAWNWLAGGAGSANNDGAITSTVSFNSTSQFSVIKYTGTGGATNFGHGLDGTPDFIMIKNMSADGDWNCWHNSFGTNDRIKLNESTARTNNTSIFAAQPDATKIYIGSGGDVSQNTNDFICYAWKNVPGYSKVGTFHGNGQVDGPFVYLGFKPTYFMCRNRQDAANWTVFDNKRSSAGGYNEIDLDLTPNNNSADDTSTAYNDVDFLSNGVKIREDNGDLNGSGKEIIYIAFGQTMVGTNDNPATAR